MMNAMQDTSPAQLERYYELLRSLSPEERGRIMGGLCRGARKLAEEGIRQAHPDASSEEQREQLTVRLYGATVARRLHGGVKGHS